MKAGALCVYQTRHLTGNEEVRSLTPGHVIIGVEWRDSAVTDVLHSSKLMISLM